jgi:hypothetical protein
MRIARCSRPLRPQTRSNLSIRRTAGLAQQARTDSSEFSDSEGGSSGLSFEGGRVQGAQRCVPALGVVSADVSEQGVAGLAAGVKLELPELFDLEGCEEEFGRRVVPAIAFATHAANDARGLQRLTVVAAGILAAAVGVMEEPRCRSSRTDVPAQRADHHVAVALPS